MHILRSWLPGGICFFGLGLLSASSYVRATEPAATNLNALIVGGGPDRENNAAQIEGHVRFVVSLLPPSVKHVVLFADGKADQASVAYADTSDIGDAQRALAILLADHEAGEPVLMRIPKLGASLDGPARLQSFRHSLAKLSIQAGKPPATLLLYFAGHGTQDEKDERNTCYDLWNGDLLTVRDLSEEMSRLPHQTPVVLVMAQCFSGAFADLLFAHGDPKTSLTGQNMVGFFSAHKDREAAGCSYATERADYQDFSSYFFGALSGHDRFGEQMTGADYDGNGSVSLHEAFCYALIHDLSADTPVCTSDVFLRREALLPNETIYTTPYREAWQMGTPAQRAVLDALSARQDLAGEMRVITVFDRLTYGDPSARPSLLKKQTEAKEQLGNVRQKSLPSLFERWPALRWKKSESENYKTAFDGATDDLTQTNESRHALLEAGKTAERADEAVDAEEADLLRFADVYEHIVEARHLREHGKPELRAQFERLWKSEQNALPLVIAR